MVAVKQAYDSGTSFPALRAGRMLRNLSVNLCLSHSGLIFILTGHGQYEEIYISKNHPWKDACPPVRRFASSGGCKLFEGCT